MTGLSPTGRFLTGPNMQGIPLNTPEVRAIREAMMEKLFPYQIEGAEFLAARKVALLADEPRVGKTAAAIRACDMVGAERILWVTTGSARWDHKAAWERFSTVKRSVRVLTSGKDRFKAGPQVVILSSDLLPPLAQYLMTLPWDVVVLDESHRYKNHAAKRTKAVYGPRMDRLGGVTENAKHVWCLSGTPAPNNYTELWPMLHALAPERIVLTTGKPAKYWAFADRFCIVKSNGFGTEIAGSRNGQELKQRMAGFSLRRTLQEIAPQVPRLRVDTLPLDASHLIPRLTELARKHPELQVIADCMEDPDKPGAKQRLQAALSAGAGVLQQIGLLKVDSLVEWLKEEPPAKRVVFAWHTQVIDTLRGALMEAGIGCVKLDGSVVGETRQRIVENFRSNPQVDILIGQIVAAGEGIDLSVADEVVFIESSWVPGHNEQASRRVVNVAKTRPTNARFVIVPGTIDERLQSSVARKVADIAKLF